ncbi:MAG: hypothetical protein EAY75_13375 [Bacteroidetes bacterium]|nr:MAG: hypothetical protein EAY75_13375 [Bacteroidota bacterium]
MARRFSEIFNWLKITLICGHCKAEMQRLFEAWQYAHSNFGFANFDIWQQAHKLPWVCKAHPH